MAYRNERQEEFERDLQVYATQSTSIGNGNVGGKIAKYVHDIMLDPVKGFKAPEGYDVGKNIINTCIYLDSEVANWRGCTNASVYGFFLDMVQQGLSVSSKQCYAIVYGNKLKLMRSYFGTITALGYIAPDLQVCPQVLYEKDSFDVAIDPVYSFKYIVNHKTSFSNQDGEIIGAYCHIVDRNTGKIVFSDVMTMKQIRVSWSHTTSKSSKVQQETPDQMARRTVINRTCKMVINTRSEYVKNQQMADVFVKDTSNEYDEEEPINITPAEVQKEVRSKSKGAEGLKRILKAQEQSEPVVEKTVEEVVEQTPAVEEVPTDGRVQRDDLFDEEEYPTDDVSRMLDENLPF